MLSTHDGGRCSAMCYERNRKQERYAHDMYNVLYGRRYMYYHLHIGQLCATSS